MSDGNFRVFQSTNLQSGRYDPLKEWNLTLQFTNSYIYEYYQVPAERWEGLKSATDPTQYLRDVIEPNHRWHRIYPEAKRNGN